MPGSEDNKSEVASQTKSFEPTLLQWPSSRLESGSSRPLELFLNTLSTLMALVIIVYVGFLFVYNGRDIASLPPMWKFIHEFSKLVRFTSKSFSSHLIMLTQKRALPLFR